MNFKPEKSYCKRLYSSNSFVINLYIYRHLYYALNLTELDEKKTILDLGCGDGPFLPTLNRYGKKIIGLDVSFSMLLNAKILTHYNKYPLKEVFLINSEGHYLPFKDRIMDIIFCLETFEHIPNSTKLINEIYRILKEDGELIYSIPIEIGLSLIFRQLIGKIINFPRDTYTFKELIRNGILKKPSKRINNPHSHKNFDWRIIQRLITKKFKQIKIIYSPFPFLKTFNTTLICKVSKKTP